MKTLSYLLIFFFLFSCQNKTLVTEYWDDGSLKRKTTIEKKYNYSKTEVVEVFYTTKYYKKGVLDSNNFYLKELYYDNGQLMEKCSYLNEVKVGKFESWYKNGIKESEIIYRKGMKHGTYKTWLPDGKENETLYFYKDSCNSN